MPESLGDLVVSAALPVGVGSNKGSMWLSLINLLMIILGTLLSSKSVMIHAFFNRHVHALFWY